MVLTGNMTHNVLLQNNDIIYIPPTFFGLLTRFVEKLLEPVNVIVRALFGFASIETAYRSIVDDEPSGNRSACAAL